MMMHGFVPWHLIIFMLPLLIAGVVVAIVLAVRASNRSNSPYSQSYQQYPAIAPSAPAAGWYPDPSDPTVQRWWTGQSWGPSAPAAPPAPPTPPV